MPGYLAGRGIADITGEPADTGMLGYGKSWQRSDGIHLRLRSRAFVIAEAAGGRRLLLVVNDLPMVFGSVRGALLDRLRRSYGALYTEHNTLVTATHTHSGPGGYSHHRLYHSNTGGFRPKTFAAIVDGMTEAVGRAHDDLAPPYSPCHTASCATRAPTVRKLPLTTTLSRTGPLEPGQPEDRRGLPSPVRTRQLSTVPRRGEDPADSGRRQRRERPGAAATSTLLDVRRADRGRPVRRPVRGAAAIPVGGPRLRGQRGSRSTGGSPGTAGSASPL
jgi:hypothetical protein